MKTIVLYVSYKRFTLVWHIGITNISVDGLAICNEQIVRSIKKESLNASHSGGNVANSSKGSSHSSANFPFAEGNLFTATLWAGAEGFHMTINGRHETSFSYREVRYNIICNV